MRRAQVNMSWSDSMSSSITLTGSRANVARQHRGSRLRPSPGDQTLQRLVRELHASRIAEEPEYNMEEELAAILPADITSAVNPQHTPDDQITPSTSTSSSSSSSSRSRRMLLSIKRKTQRLAYLLSYHISRMWQHYASANVLYRPLQMGLY
ncbi:hypothetical protein GGI15_004234 [Coemansia interrupta]|uniref:Uncharacterized protein n=1 Tax=Coemansia interrupta TaxID=1126814 RepID=A0A9W8H890_9FUNG|nr:hypothetical protein GGI15_004234 [Coemansia interrupta]